MGQNLAVQPAVQPGKGSVQLNLDATGNLLVAGAQADGATQIASSSGDVAAASAVATLAGAAGKTTYISGLTITGGGATGASVVNAVLSGTLGGSLTFNIPVPAGVTLGIAPVIVQFNPPLPASAVNTAIVLTLPTLGAGNAHAAVSAWGYQK